MNAKSLSSAVRNEVTAYLLEGNAPHDLAGQLIDTMNAAELKDLLEAVVDYHEQCGDAPHTWAMMTTPLGRNYAHPFRCGDRVHDRRDARHVGRIEHVFHTATVRWEESGWLSELRLSDLRLVEGVHLS